MPRKWKVLNLYAGIGGNRKLWKNVDVTAVEINKDIARFYQKNFPRDKVIITDAHQFLLKHFKEFDFIWSSPPCSSHSVARKNIAVPRGQCKPVYPDMRLYQEIIFLQHYFKGKWVVENVISYYKPLIKTYLIHRHYFWSNFPLTQMSIPGKDNIERGKIREWEQRFGFDLSKYHWHVKGKRERGIEKDVVLKNCVNPKLGLHILKDARGNVQNTLEVYHA